MASPDLVSYIRETKSQGYRLDQIKSVLTERGWPEDQVHEAIKEALTPQGAISHHLDTGHSTAKSGLVIALTITFVACYLLGVVSKPLSYLFPQLQNPFGEFFIAPMVLSLSVLAITLILAISLRKVFGVL